MASDEESPLVDQNQIGSQTLNHGRDIHILSWAFLLIFLAYGAAQNLQSTLNTDGDLGTISLGILYTSFTVSSLFASSVVRKLGSKNALLLGTTGYWLYIAANLKPSWYTMVPASLYLGFAAAILWVGEGTYLTSTARSQANDHKLHEGTVIGHFNGEFWAIFASHQLVGNLLTLALLRDGEEGSTSGTTLLFTVFLGSMTLGTILMAFLKRRDGEETEGQRDSSVGFCTSLVSLWKHVVTPLCDTRLLLIVPLIAYSGLQQAFVWAEFTKFFVQPYLGESGVGGAMAVYGVFDAICSLAAGRFTSGLTSITLIVSGGAILQGGILIWLLSYSASTGVLGLVYPLLIAAIWGIGDGVLMTQLNALLAMLFKHDMLAVFPEMVCLSLVTEEKSAYVVLSDPTSGWDILDLFGLILYFASLGAVYPNAYSEGTFAQLKLWQSASIAVVFFLSPNISLQAMLFVMLAALLLSLACFLFLVLKVEKVFSSNRP